MLDTIVQDLNQAARRLVRAPAFTVSAALILAFGIGASTAIFSLVDAFLFRPQPFERPQELVDIYQDSDSGDPVSTSYPAYLDMAEYRDVFAGVVAVLVDFGTLFVDGGGQPVALEFVTSNYYPLLGLRPSHGRWFEAAEDQVAGGEAVAVVSHRAWRLKLDSDPDIVGRVVRLNGTPVTIVGVGQEGYGGLGPGMAIDFWLSISSVPPVGGPFRAGNLRNRQDHPFMVKARLLPDVSVAQAQGAMNGLATRLAAEYPELNRGRDITVFGAGDVRLHPRQDLVLYPAAGFLMAVVTLVLIIACSNVANLVLVRGSTRGRELAIRLAMGASRGRLIRHLLSESMLLAALGGSLGVVVAFWLVRALVRFQPPLPFPIAADLRIDGAVLAFALVLSLGTGLAFGILPALRSSRPQLVSALKDGSFLSAGRWRWLTLRGTLVVAQVAVSLVLLVGAGLLIRSLSRAQEIALGFSPHGLAVIQTDPSHAGYSPGETGTYYEELQRRLRSVPGVTAAALTSRLPVTLLGMSSSMIIEGYDAPHGADGGTGAAELANAVVDAGYFETMDIALSRGRSFDRRDHADAQPVIVVSEAMAQTYWGSLDVVGRRIRPQSTPDAWLEVVGVARDVKVSSYGEPSIPFFYRTVEQGAPSRLYTVVRGDLLSSTLVARVRQETQALDPSVPIFEARAMEDHLGAALFLPRATAWLLIVLGAVALFLACLGLYSVVAFTVSRRTAEVGVRMALGASRSRVVGMVLREVAVLVAIGAGLGVGLSLLAAPGLGSMLHGLAPSDPLTYAAVVLLLALVALAAATAPARRAANTDPVEALRYE